MELWSSVGHVKCGWVNQLMAVMLDRARDRALGSRQDVFNQAFNYYS